MVGKRQIAALKYLISRQEISDLAKKVAFFLIDNSMLLSQEVCITLTNKGNVWTEEEVQDVVSGFSVMQSSNCGTHLHALMVLSGSGFVFTEHYGNWNKNLHKLDVTGMFPGWRVDQVSDPKLLIEGMPLRYTFWLSRYDYGHRSKEVRFLQPQRTIIENINLKKTGLYSSLEKD